MSIKGGDLRAIVVMACDLAGDGSRLGPETISRCKEGLRIHIEHPRSFIILTAGKPDMKKWPGNSETTAIMMAEYFEKWMVPRSYMKISAWPSTWGSMAELEEAFRLSVLSENPEYAKLFSSVTVVSSNYHTPRLKFICWKLKKKYNSLAEIREISFVGVTGKWSNTAMEFLKFPLFVIKELLLW